MGKTKANFQIAADVFDTWRDDVLTGEAPTLYPVGSGELARIEIGPKLVTLIGGSPGAGKLKGEIMGTVFKKTVTKPLPTEAKIIVRKGQRLAEWVDAKQKRRTAPVTTGKDGTDRIVITTRTYSAKYRDGSGIVKEVATGCRDESAARSILAKLKRRAELVKGEVLTASDDERLHRSEAAGRGRSGRIAPFAPADWQDGSGTNRRKGNGHR